MEHNFTWKNDGRTKVMIGCGTRPEIIRLAAVIKRCREYFDCCVVYYNQNWDRNLSTVFWEDFELKNTFGEYGPDILVPVVGENLGVTCGNILGRSYELLSELQPEGYLVLGDTNSCLSAISAKRLHIPLFHMEAGNRCKDECLPEETNRRIVDVISDVNMCYSEFARKYLADTGLPKERTYQTGSPMAEVLHMNLEKIQKSDVLERLGLEKDKYILLSAHREENIDSEKNFLSLFTAINALAEKYDMPILYSCHPRSKHRLEKSGFQLDPRVRVNEPLGFNDYNKLQMNALAIVSDSGTLPEESSFYLSIGHPIAAVCIRTSTERPEALEAGDFILAGITTRELLNATDMAIEMKQKGVLGKPCPDYVDETVSMKVVRIIQGYEYMAKNGCRIGGEQSGHIIFSKYASTGDGILTSLKMMEVMLAKKLPMSKLAEPLKIYPQVLENVRVTDKKAAQDDEAVQAAVKAAAEALGDTGRILVRESGTEPVVRVMVEAPDHDTCQKYVDEVVETIKSRGYGV